MWLAYKKPPIGASRAVGGDAKAVLCRHINQAARFGHSAELIRTGVRGRSERGCVNLWQGLGVFENPLGLGQQLRDVLEVDSNYRVALAHVYDDVGVQFDAVGDCGFAESEIQGIGNRSFDDV